MIDSPQTPTTPDSPLDITAIRDTEEDDAPLSYPDCVDLARAVRYCSQSLIEGTWSEESTVRGRRPIFNPSSFESAKAFLKASVERVQGERRAHRSLSDTPLTSRPRFQSRMPTCHGCNGPMGQGQHQGSAPGKLPCTLPHSPYCRGGVVEDSSWRACPTDYQFDPNLDMASGPGFENTMHTLDFRPHSVMLSGPAISTPVVHADGGHDQHLLGAISRYSGVDRLPDGVGMQGQTATPDFPPGAALLPLGAAVAPLGAVAQPGAGVSQDGEGVQQIAQQLPETIQGQIDVHRSNNQAENIVTGRPNGIDITHLRVDADLRFGVNDFMESVIRQRIPSLSAAQTAPASVAVLPPRSNTVYFGGDQSL